MVTWPWVHVTLRRGTFGHRGMGTGRLAVEVEIREVATVGSPPCG